MPSLTIFGRRTLLGGDDLQPGCLITITIRLFQSFFLLTPISAHLFKQGHSVGFKNYFLQSLYPSLECHESYMFPLLTLIYCNITAVYFLLSIFFEYKLMKASSIGTLTQPHLRNDEVIRYMKMKMIPFNCLLFINFGIGVTSIYMSNLFYACFQKYEEDYVDSLLVNIETPWEKNDFNYQNVTQKELIFTLSSSPSDIFKGTSTWLLFFILLQITQATEITYSIFSLFRLFMKPKGVHTHLTLEEFIRSGGDRSHYTEAFHHHEQDHMGLYDALWEERCKFWCKCSGQITCFLFGGKEVGSGNYSDISRILTDYFEHGGILDIVPSDIAAALIALRKIQRQGMLNSRRSIIETRKHILESMPYNESSNASLRTECDFELKNPTLVTGSLPINLSSTSLVSSDSFYTARNLENDDNPREFSPSFLNPRLEFSQPSVLIRDRRTDQEIICEGARFARHALAIYTWMLYIYMKPICGFCDLACADYTNRKNKHDKGCLQYSCDDSCRSQNSRLKAPSTESMDRNPIATRIKGDILCQFHKKALLKQAGLNDSDIVYAQFENGLKETPYCIVLDHSWKSVVLAIRGTLSLEDCVMDVLVGAQPLDDLGNMYGFDGDGEFIHSGIFESTKWITEDLGKHQQLETIMAQYPNYTLRLVGHSLGAGCATLLSLMLRQTYPTLKCLAYSPPGGFCTERTALACKEFVTSFVLHNDLVPRLSIENLEALRNEILSLIGRIRVPKVEVLGSIFNSNINESIGQLLHPEGSSPSNSDYALQLEKFKQIQKERKEQRGAIEVSMYPPGKIMHLVKTSEKKAFLSRFKHKNSSAFDKSETKYTPCWVENDVFNEIVVSPSMGTDHFQSNVCLELENLATHFGVDVRLGSSKQVLDSDIWFDTNDLELQSS